MWGGGACVQVENRPGLQSSSRYLSCFYGQGTNLSFVFRKHLVPWEFLNLCVCTSVCRGCICGVCITCTCACHVGMHAYAFVCVCVCIHVPVCTPMFVCVHACAYISTLSHEEGGLLSCTRARDDLISPGPSCPTCWALVMAKPFQTWNAE